MPLLSLQVSSFVLRYSSSEIHDRYVMYLAPMLFLGLALFLYADVRRSSFVGAAAAALVFFRLAEESDYEGGAEFFASPVAVFHPVLTGRAEQLGDLLGTDNLTPTPLVQLVAIATAIGLPLALRHLPREARDSRRRTRGLRLLSRPVRLRVRQGPRAGALRLGHRLDRPARPGWRGCRPRAVRVRRLPPAGLVERGVLEQARDPRHQYGDVDDFTPFPSGHLELDDRTGALTATDMPLSSRTTS